MTEVYTIQKGDTLTGIVQQKYGLKGNEAYQKALQLAKENNIKNPNLIYAGANLNLFGLEEKDEAAPAGDTFVQNPKLELLSEETKGQPTEDENIYNLLIDKQSRYARALSGLIEDNAEIDTSVTFARLNNNETLEEDYFDGLLNLAEQDLEVNDTEDANGIKDGKTDVDEFIAQQLAFYRSTYGDLDTSDDDLAKALGLQDIFNMYDIDDSGYLETNEIAFSYMMADVNFDTTLFGKTPAINLENHAEFDGIIDFEQMMVASQLFNDDMLNNGGKTYKNIYNKVSDKIELGIINRKNKAA